MAEIFLALQIGAEGFEKPVVLKRILPALASDPAFVRMLVDEAHIVSTLNHSNLVQVLDLGQAGDQFFLVLEFVDGFSLEQVRRRARKLRMKVPLPLALYIGSSLCRALDYVHRRTRNGRPLGIVHRDVTPQNVLISREGEVKLADFGIAKAVGKRERSVTGVIKGKFAYMSPEQAMGGELDARSDLFSMGTLLYVLTTGRKPFDAPTDLEVLMQVRRARFEKPSNFVRDFNPDVERFLARALRSEKSKRFQSAEQMADRLDKILVKLGQPTGPMVLKRWLDGLSARDGVLPPGELREAPAELPTSTIELKSGELELQEVARASASAQAEDDLDLSNAETGFAAAHLIETVQAQLEPTHFHEAATVVADAAYPAELPTASVSAPDAARLEADKHTITIVVPNGMTVVGLTPGADDVKVRHEGVTNELAVQEEADDDADAASDMDEPEAPPSAPSATPVHASAESSHDISLDIEVVSSEVMVSNETIAADPPAPTVRQPPRPAPALKRPRRWLFRLSITTLLSLLLFGGGLFAARHYLPSESVPAEVVDRVEQWLERLPWPLPRG